MTKYDGITLSKIRGVKNWKEAQDMNEIFWSDKQIELILKNKNLIQNGFSENYRLKRIDYTQMMNTIRGTTCSNNVVKERIQTREKSLKRKLTLSEKHIIRDNYIIESMMGISKLKREECEEILNNDLELATKGNTVVFLIDPKSVALKKKKPDSERIRVKFNTNFNDTNIRYGYFQRFKTDSTGKTFILIKDIQREYIGEKLDASPTAYSYSMIGLSRIKRMFVLKGNEWVEFTDDSNKIVKNVWKELE